MLLSPYLIPLYLFLPARFFFFFFFLFLVLFPPLSTMKSMATYLKACAVGLLL